ncbi:MAG: coiled-coil domain-containing protein [bacterium]
MDHHIDREAMNRILRYARRRIYWYDALYTLLGAGLFLYPPAGILIGADHRWGREQWSLWIAISVNSILMAYSLMKPFLQLGRNVKTAFRIDQDGRLQDRICSAYKFMEQRDLAALDPHLEEPCRWQIQDAIQHAYILRTQTVFRFPRPRYVMYLPVALLIFIGGFFIPPAFLPLETAAGVPAGRALQLNELETLEEQLRREEFREDQEVLKAVEKIQEVKRRFEKGEMNERELMLELARLQEHLEQSMSALGVQKMFNEVSVLLPHLKSSSATTALAKALQEENYDQAIDELNQLAEAVEKDRLTLQERRDLAANLGVAASKLKTGTQLSFKNDLQLASDALKRSDNPDFKEAARMIQEKLELMIRACRLRSACRKILARKAYMGGYGMGNAGMGSGGARGPGIGTGAMDPFGEASRLNGGKPNPMQVKGQLGAGEVESEIEVTDGQLSASQLERKERQADFSAQAEEVIENEDIPLGHRFHVKKYFQAIRPRD